MKKLIFPQEIEVWYILPAIRKQLAIELVKGGLTQSQVSKLLDCSRASITQYIKKQRGHAILNQNIKKEVKKSSNLIIKNKSNVFQEIMRINQLVKNTGLLCQLHRKLGLTRCSCQSDCHLEG